MGSFNKIGFISSLPITAGDETTLIFLKPNKYAEKGGITYSTDWYEPIFLPVFGQYDDYGKIDGIKRTDSVKFIEDFFGLDIDKIVEDIDNLSVGRYGSKELEAPKNNDVYKKLTFGLEHTSVFEKMASKKRTYYTEGYVVEYWLRKLGFVQGPNGTDERYKKTFTHVDLPGYIYKSDGTWGHLEDSNGKKVDYIYHVDDMVREMKNINPNIKINLTKEDETMCQVDLSIECTKLAIEQDNANKLEDPKEEMMHSWMGIKKYQGIPNISEYLSKVLIDGKSYSHDSRSLPIDLINTVNAKEIGDMIRFNWSVSNLNAKYQPSNYGSQDDAIMFHFEMLKCYKSVVKTKLMEQMDWMEDEELDELKAIFAEMRADDREDAIDLVLA